MAPDAIVAIDAEIGKEVDVLGCLKKIEAVTSVEAVYGIYGIIARVHGNTKSEAYKTVNRKIGKLDGVKNTLIFTVADGASFVRDDLLPADSPELKTSEKCAYLQGKSFYEIPQKEGPTKIRTLNSLDSVRMSGAAIGDFILGYSGQKLTKEGKAPDRRSIINYCSQVCKLFSCGINEHPDNPKYKKK